MTALLIAGWSQTDASHGAVIHVVAVFLVRLNVGAKLENGMLGCIELLSSHDIVRRIFLRDTVIGWECISPEDRVLHKMYQDDPWDVSERQQTVCTSRTILDRSNVSLNFGHVFVSGGCIEGGVPWSKSFKLTVSHD